MEGLMGLNGNHNKRRTRPDRERVRGLLRVGVFLLVCLGLTACATLMMGTREESPIVFDHSRHLDVEIDCTICHAGIESSTTEVGVHLPSEDTCLFCHQTWKDEGRCEMCHAAGEEPRTYLPQEAEPLYFSHAGHADLFAEDGPGEEGCKTCHLTIGRSDEARDRNLPSMESCLNCHSHDEDFAMLECDSCHRTLRNVSWRPLARFDHGPNWMDRHQTFARERVDLCAQCHDQNYCGDCHHLNDIFPPSFIYPERVDASFIHEDDWLSRHGLEARFEQDSCVRCHSTTFCRDCHHGAGVDPTSRDFLDGVADNPHPAGWLVEHGRQARREIHVCASCHSGGSDSICLDCHSSGGFNPHPPGFRSSLSRTEDKVCRVCHF